MNFLHELFWGNIHPFEMPLSVDRTLIETLAEAEHRFRDSLSPEQQALFETFDNLHLQVNTIEMEQRFADAFRLGAEMMKDLLAQKNETGSLS